MRDRIARRRALWVLLWRAGRRRLVLLCALAALQGLLPVMTIVASGVLIDAIPHALRDGTASPAADKTLAGLGFFAAALLLGAGVAALADYQAQVLNGRYGRAVHQGVARATLGTQGIAPLEDPSALEQLSALAQFEQTDGFVTAAANLRQLVQRRSTGVAAFVVLAGFAWWAPLVMLAGWRGLSYGINRWLEHGIELDASIAATRLRWPRYLRSLAVEPQAAKEVRIFGLAGWLVNQYADSYLAALRAIWAGRRLGMRTVLSATPGVMAAHALVLGVMGWRAAAGDLPVAELVVYAQAVLASSALGYVFGVQIPLARARQVAWQVLRLERQLGAAGPPAPAPGIGPSRAAGGPVEVALRQVRFTYRGQPEPTLDGLDLTVPAGRSLAVVGDNGAGKSTLIKLLCGLYQPDSGLIRLAGGTAQDNRHRVAVIFQNFVRYELSLRANVGFGSLKLSEDDDALAQALTQAGGASLVQRLPAGWDTVLSAGFPAGQDLSGGEWQKIALARALLAVRGGAGLLILDEPTASLDVRAEAELFGRFLEFTRGTTTILVSHRLASVRRADRIAVIHGGRVAEEGSHDELLAAGGWYATMFALQAQRFESPHPAAVAAQPDRNRDRGPQAVTG